MVNRVIAGYKAEGMAFFVHGNKGRQPATTIPDETRRRIVELYRTKYYGANFAHFTELLRDVEGITVSASSVASILEAAGILSPRVTRAKRKRVKKELAASTAASTTPTCTRWKKSQSARPSQRNLIRTT